MTTNEQPKKRNDQQAQDRRQQSAAIGQQVLDALGEPGDLHRVQVRLLWEGRYRVNVLTGVDAVCARVRHSYFLVTDGDGTIVAATPEIMKLY